ncbi:MAG: DUF308 domain-containing protein [Clostridia bacterium]|nr:DUF308 domain-containing protein [Clostridia bacterium]
MDIHSLFTGFKINAILTALVELVLGIFLILNPTASQFALCSLVGCGILIYGVFSIITYIRNHEGYWDHARLIAGICAVIVALIFFANPGFLFGFVGTIIGFFIIVSAFGEIRRAMTLNAFGFDQWWVALISGIVFICFGISLVFFPGFYGNLLMRVIGVFLVLEAVSDLLTVHRITVFAKNGRQNIVIRY